MQGDIGIARLHQHIDTLPCKKGIDFKIEFRVRRVEIVYTILYMKSSR